MLQYIVAIICCCSFVKTMWHDVSKFLTRQSKLNGVILLQYVLLATVLSSRQSNLMLHRYFICPVLE